MLRNRPIPEDPNIRPIIRDPYEQVYAAHQKRIWVYIVVHLILGSLPFAVAAFLYRSALAKVFSPTYMMAWVLYHASQFVAMYGRYHCSFCSSLDRGSLVVLCTSALTGILIGALFHTITPTHELQTPHYRSLLLLTSLLSGVSSGVIFLWRGYLSSRGLGIWKKPGVHGYGRGRVKAPSPLKRGFDQVMPAVENFIEPSERHTLGPFGGTVPVYGRWLIPPLDMETRVPDWVPHWATDNIKWVTRNMVRRPYLLAEQAEYLECFWWSWQTWVGAAIILVPMETFITMIATVTGLGPFTSAFIKGSAIGARDLWWHLGLGWRAYLVSMLAYFGTSLNTLVLYHILLQPMNYGLYTTLGGPVLKPWLEKGYELAITPVADARKQDLVTREEPLWVTEKEEHNQVFFRLAALANTQSFPPTVDLYSRISVNDRMNRALAFHDVAILAATSAGRRKWIYYDRRLWTAVGNPLVTVVNALTLQLELQIEAESRVEGGPASPLQNLHTRLGVAEVRDGESLAKLIIESEVIKRHEELLLERERQGEPITELPKVPLLPAYTNNGLGLPIVPTLTMLRIPSIEIQVVECAVRALGSFFEKSIEIEKASKQFEDYRASSRPTIPSAVVALLSLQLAIHAYSAATLGPTQSAYTGTLRLHDRPSTVLAPFLRLSLAIDNSIEKILYYFYETEFESWTFAPIYTKCLQAYVRGMLKEPDQPDPAMYLED